MEKLNTKKYFGKKIRFAGEVHPEIKEMDFCVVGIQENAVAVVEWDKRGEYVFDYYTLKSLNDIRIIEDDPVIDPDVAAINDGNMLVGKLEALLSSDEIRIDSEIGEKIEDIISYIQDTMGDSEVVNPVLKLAKADNADIPYEEIEIKARWRDSGEEFTANAAIGQWDEETDDDDVAYWFDDYDKIFGEEHTDFVVLSYKKADSDVVITSDVSPAVAAMSDDERKAAMDEIECKSDRNIDLTQ